MGEKKAVIGRGRSGRLTKFFFSAVVFAFCLNCSLWSDWLRLTYLWGVISNYAAALGLLCNGRPDCSSGDIRNFVYKTINQ